MLLMINNDVKSSLHCLTSHWWSPAVEVATCFLLMDRRSDTRHLVSPLGHFTFELISRNALQRFHSFFNYCTLWTVSDGLRVCARLYLHLLQYPFHRLDVIVSWPLAATLHAYVSAIYRAMEWGCWNFKYDHRWLCTKSTIRRWHIDESITSPISRLLVHNDLKHCYFITSPISHTQCMLSVGVCSPSFNCTPYPSDKSCCSALQDEAMRRANHPPLAVTAKTRRVLHDIESVPPSRRPDGSTVNITLIRIRVTSWKGCVVPPSDDAHVCDVMNETVCNWSKRVHWIARTLCRVHTIEDGLHYCLASRRPRLDSL